jgi:diguanylate cyclase (GGDEF)-like protein
MTSHESALERPPAGLIAGRLADLRSALRSTRIRIRSSDYVVIGQSRRFQAVQRGRTRTACRVGFLVIAAAVGFDAVALLGLQGSEATIALGLSATTVGLAVAGWLLLPHRLRRFPEPVAWVVTMGVVISTAVTGITIPSLDVQSAGYLLVIPGLVALVVPWRTRTHIGWLLAYALVAVGYFILDANSSFTLEERADLVVVLLVALGASLAGHVLLRASQARSFAQLERIRVLQRRAAKDVVELEQAHHALELTARTDPLTGAGNRRRLDEDLRAVRAHIQRSGFVYGLVEIDLDRFKAINDSLGHAAGDDVLRRVVGALQGTLRANDAVYRLGGEEFFVILSVPTMDALAAATDRLRKTVLGLEIEHPANPPHGIVSVSLGATLVGIADLAETDEAWFHRIDRALYAAKDGGRNRVEFALSPLVVSETTSCATAA